MADIKLTTQTQLTQAIAGHDASAAAHADIRAAAEEKVDKEAGKGLSKNDYTDAEKTKLAGLSNYDDSGLRGALEDHEKEEVGTLDGVHGLRWFGDKLQFYSDSDSEWIEIKTGGRGLAPLDVAGPSIEVGRKQLTVYWTDPPDTEIEGTVVTVWEGTKLVRKTGGYPTGPLDGELLADNKVRGAYAVSGFTDTGLTVGVTYYYQLFPYSVTDMVNGNATNRLSGVPDPYEIFGVSIDLTNTNPAAAVTYTDDAAGMTPGSGWDTQPVFKDIKPCVLKNGAVQYYLDPTDFSKKADGTAADITSGGDGDVMIEIPKCGLAIHTSEDTLTVKITADTSAPDHFKYYAHTRAAEGDREKLYIGAYLGYVSGSKLRSLSGKTPTGGQNMNTWRTQARANGSGYDMVSFYPLTLLQALYLIKYRNLYSQAALGRGYVDDNSAAIATGGTNAKGIDYGETTGKQQMKFLGIEDLWGNLHWWIDGLWTDSDIHILTAFTGFNDTGAGYTDRGQGAAADIVENYMGRPQGSSETGFIIKETGGGGSARFTDRAAIGASRTPDFGGYWISSSLAGVFYLVVYHKPNYTHANRGARLMYL
jgi:hypothetical protein